MSLEKELPIVTHIKQEWTDPRHDVSPSLLSLASGWTSVITNLEKFEIGDF